MLVRERRHERAEQAAALGVACFADSETALRLAKPGGVVAPCTVLAAQ
jgi:hypothetical protein